MKRLLAASFLATAIAHPVFAQEDGYALDCTHYPQSDFAAAWNASERQDQVLRGNPDRYKAYDAFVRDFWTVMEQQQVTHPLKFQDIALNNFDGTPTVGDFLDALQNAFLTAWDRAGALRSYGGHASLTLSIPEISSEDEPTINPDTGYTDHEWAFSPDDLRTTSLKDQEYTQAFLDFQNLKGFNVRLRIHRGDNPQPKNFYYISIAQHLNVYRSSTIDDPMGALLGDGVISPPPYSIEYHGPSLAGAVCRALTKNTL